MNYKLLIMLIFVISVVSCSVEQPIGGERDEHGCLGAAGYSYDADVGACTRNWELDDNQARAAKVAVDYITPVDGATITEVAVGRCPGCFVVTITSSAYDLYKVTLMDWKAKDLSPEDQEFIDAVANQTALALESARLLDEANRRIERERALIELTNKFALNLDFETLLKTVVRELSQLPMVTDASIYIKPPKETDIPDNGRPSIDEELLSNSSENDE